MDHGDDSASLTPEEKATLAEAEAEIERGERVAPEIVREFWRRRGL